MNCVRWSESGRYLASAADDSLITIMQFAGRLASANDLDQASGDANRNKNVELWKCVHTLRGHAGGEFHDFDVHFGTIMVFLF